MQRCCRLAATPHRRCRNACWRTGSRSARRGGSCPRGRNSLFIPTRRSCAAPSPRRSAASPRRSADPDALSNGCHAKARARSSRNRQGCGLSSSGCISAIEAEFVSTSLPAQRGDNRHIAEGATFSIILALSFSHFLNDTMQSLVPALYPMLKDSYGLSFAQIGLITLTMQVTSSFLQPMVGLFADHRPQPYSLAVGMGVTFIGLLLLARAARFFVPLPRAALGRNGACRVP